MTDINGEKIFMKRQSGIDSWHWLLTKPIAHRGLWNDKIVENSLSAYENAALNGYPVEIDIYMTTDGEIVSFHDKTLKRMTGADGNIFDADYSELKKLRLKNGEEKIPTLQEVLELINGRVPLLIEFKDQPNKNFIETAVNILKKYKGEFAVQSFNPMYLYKIKKLAPEFLRGILATENAQGEKPHIKYILKHMSLNFLCKPDFISYSYTGLPLKKSKTKNLPVIAWTVTDKDIAQKIKPYCKNIIFENFIPD